MPRFEPTLRRGLKAPLLPALLWSLIVALLLLTPAASLPDPGLWDWLDKPVHALLFAVHAGLLSRALPVRLRRGRKLATAAVSGLYGGLLEVAQLWVPGRGLDGWDLVADASGIGAMVLLLGWRRASILPAS